MEIRRQWSGDDKTYTKNGSFLPISLLYLDGPLHDKEDGVKISYLKLWAGDKGLDLFEGFAFAKPEDDLKLKVALQKFEEYCALRKKTHYGCLEIQ